MKNSCMLVPDAGNGNESRLFKDLIGRGLPRETAKKIWAFTKTDTFKQDAPVSIEYDENGEPTIGSLSTIMDIDSFAPSTEVDDKATAKDSGIVDSSGKPVVFDKADTALTQAAAYNRSAKDTVAVVEQVRNGFKATVKPRTVDSLIESDKNEARRVLNRALLQMLERLGFNIGFSNDPSYYGVFDPLLAEDNAELLKTVIAISNDELGLEALPEEACHLIIAGMRGHKLRERLDAAFTDDVVREVLGEEYDMYKRKYADDGMLAERLREEAEGKMLARMLKGENINTKYENQKNNDILTINRDEYTDEFRRVQEESNRLVEEDVAAYHRGRKQLDANEQRLLGAAFKRLLSRNLRTGANKWVDLIGKGNTFHIAQVNATLFYDVFETVRKYLPNGELVDLHDNYDNCKCFLSDDGLCGFAIEPGGNLVSILS